MIALEKKYTTALYGYKFIDLFCGIGGFHLALKAFGAECTFASEIDEQAKKIYENNFAIKPQGDITKISRDNIPEHDIICAGFPCQPFSISGKGAGFNDKKRGMLFFEITRIAKHHEPKVILLENVANLETHDEGKSIKRIFKKLKKIGYTPFRQTLNAADFGVPQSRKRLYIIAFHKSLGVSEFCFPVGMSQKVSVKTILEDEKNTINYRINREFTLIEKYEERELTWAKHYIRIGKIGKGRQGERIYSINGCATTQSSTGGGLGGRTGMYYINKHIRKLTPRESARVMGFPDSYKISENVNQAYVQLGNSVVVDVLQHIIKEIVDKLEGVKKND